MRNILNKRNSRYCFTCFVMWLLLGLGHLNAVAQEAGGTANITGKVIDQYGNPVSGVVITMKNTDFKTVTGDDGTFEFQYKKGDMLRFSHPGFLHKEIKVNKLRNQERIFKVTLTEEFTFFYLYNSKTSRYSFFISSLKLLGSNISASFENCLKYSLAFSLATSK